MRFSRGQGEYMAAVIAVISMVLLGMLYTSIIEALRREADLSVERIAALREELKVVYRRDSHSLSMKGSGRPLYIVYTAGGELHIDRVNTTGGSIDLTTLPKYRELVEGGKAVDRVCIITYLQNMFCAESAEQKAAVDGGSVLLAASISKCTVALSRYLSDQDMFTLLESYYTYNCSASHYPVSSIGATVTFRFSGSSIVYSIVGSDGSIWGSGSLPYSSLPTTGYTLLGSRSFNYSLGSADLTVDVYIYYSFPEVGTATDTSNRAVAYVWPVPRVAVVQRLIHRDYLLTISTRASCTSLPCYLLYAVRDSVDYPWHSYSGDNGWLLRFSPKSVVDRTVGDDGYIGRSPIVADYTVSTGGVNVTVNSVNNLYCYSRVDQLYRGSTPLSTIAASADLSSYGRWLPKDFLTPLSQLVRSIYEVYVKRAMSVYNTSSASFYIYRYFYQGRSYSVYLDYTDPAVHAIEIQLRYGGSRSMYIFVLDRISG
ncbi:MAG: hypothetical protein N3D82_03290 [Ignisphaera sp.]|nr:hypothetical protein [Ignisphaera sp.]MCX8168034.1 hypothetical protein [Ignisphaera sp.]MDW8086266.1 hypothetical protein [Ignisphaera sp.]